MQAESFWTLAITYDELQEIVRKSVSKIIPRNYLLEWEEAAETVFVVTWQALDSKHRDLPKQKQASLAATIASRRTINWLRSNGPKNRNGVERVDRGPKRVDITEARYLSAPDPEDPPEAIAVSYQRETRSRWRIFVGSRSTLLEGGAQRANEVKKAIELYLSEGLPAVADSSHCVPRTTLEAIYRRLGILRSSGLQHHIEDNRRSGSPSLIERKEAQRIILADSNLTIEDLQAILGIKRQQAYKYMKTRIRRKKANRHRSLQAAILLAYRAEGASFNRSKVARLFSTTPQTVRYHLLKLQAAGIIL